MSKIQACMAKGIKFRDESEGNKGQGAGVTPPPIRISGRKKGHGLRVYTSGLR
jgi:hypothetical protein